MFGKWILLNLVNCTSLKGNKGLAYVQAFVRSQQILQGPLELDSALVSELSAVWAVGTGRCWDLPTFVPHMMA